MNERRPSCPGGGRRGRQVRPRAAVELLPSPLPVGVRGRQRLLLLRLGRRQLRPLREPVLPPPGDRLDLGRRRVRDRDGARDCVASIPRACSSDPRHHGRALHSAEHCVLFPASPRDRARARDGHHPALRLHPSDHLPEHPRGPCQRAPRREGCGARDGDDGRSSSCGGSSYHWPRRRSSPGCASRPCPPSPRHARFPGRSGRPRRSTLRADPVQDEHHHGWGASVGMALALDLDPPSVQRLATPWRRREDGDAPPCRLRYRSARCSLVLRRDSTSSFISAKPHSGRVPGGRAAYIWHFTARISRSSGSLWPGALAVRFRLASWLGHRGGRAVRGRRLVTPGARYRAGSDASCRGDHRDRASERHARPDGSRDLRRSSPTPSSPCARSTARAVQAATGMGMRGRPGHRRVELAARGAHDHDRRPHRRHQHLRDGDDRPLAGVSTLGELDYRAGRLRQLTACSPARSWSRSRLVIELCSPGCNGW